jgi:hypothetical protein
MDGVVTSEFTPYLSMVCQALACVGVSSVPSNTTIVAPEANGP